METVRLNYFNITRCGYYKFGESEPEFGLLSDVLADLQSWTKGKTMRQTKIFNPAADSEFPVYINDLAIDPKSGDSVLVTWNETPTTPSGSIASAAGDDAVGQVSIDLVDVPDGGIPGFPSYFYIIPEKSILISVRFDGEHHTGQPSASKFINEYMAKCSSYVVYTESDDGVEIKAYARTLGGTPQNVHPSYKTAVAKVPGKVEWLRKNCASIRKLVRREQLNAIVAEEHSKLSWIWKWFGVTDPGIQSSKGVKFAFELDCKLTEDQFDTLVQFDTLEDDRNSGIGFRMAGDGGEVHWLSHCLVKQEIDIAVKRSDAGIASAKDLLTHMLAMRSSLLSIMGND